MVHLSRLESQLVLVTVIASSACRNVVGRLAQRFGTVVACRANPWRIRMDKACRSPCRRRRMTSVTLRSGADVAGWLGLGIDGNEVSAVASGALAGKTRVIHLRRRESNVVLVAGIASCRRRNMPGILAQCVGVVVAAGTGPCSNTTVIVGRRFPCGGRVTGIAGLAGWDMRRRFCSRTKRGIGTTVAGRTLANCSTVVHVGRLEARECKVTRITLPTSWKVVSRLTERRRAVVAGGAAATSDKHG